MWTGPHKPHEAIVVLLCLLSQLGGVQRGPLCKTKARTITFTTRTFTGRWTHVEQVASKPWSFESTSTTSEPLEPTASPSPPPPHPRLFDGFTNARDARGGNTLPELGGRALALPPRREVLEPAEAEAEEEVYLAGPSSGSPTSTR